MGTLAAGEGITAHGFSSITADGVSHSSLRVDTRHMHELSLPRRVQTVTGSIAAGYAAHRTMVSRHTQQSGAEVLSVQPDEMTAVSDYQHRISSWMLYKTGVSRCQPPQLEPFESIAALKKTREARLRAEVDV